MTEAISEYVERLKTNAERLVIEEFPLKIAELNELVNSLNFNDRSLAEIHESLNIPLPPIVPLFAEEPRPKRRRMSSHHRCQRVAEPQQVPNKPFTVPSGPVACNNALCNLINVVKPHIRQLAEDCNVLKMWINFLIPKVEGGNVFGVSIQTMTLGEIQNAEVKAEEYINQIAGYFLARGEIVSKVIKFPHVVDYRKAVKEIDERQYLALWRTMSEVRNYYCVVYDIVTKNLEKLKNPRTTNVHLLY